MSYRDRVRTAEYIAPSGSRHEFEWFELDRTQEKKAAINELPERDGADVQDLGQASLRVPITAFISGPDYDVAADAFWRALSERGPGELRHPRWGNIAVLPVSIGQSEDHVGAARRARFTIDFVRTVATRFPVTVAQREASVESAMNAFASAAAASLSESVDVTVAAEKSEASAEFDRGLTVFNATVAGLAASDPTLAEKIAASWRSLTGSIDTLLDSPREFGLSVISLYRSPGRAVVSVWEKVRAFQTLATQLVENIANTDITSVIVAAFQALTATGAMAESTLTGTLERRDRAVASAEILKSTYDTVIAALEGREGSQYREAQDVLAALENTVTTAYSLLLERSFSLKVERRIVLDGDTTPLELADRFYPTEALDTALDTVIEENSLVDSEIMLVPRGREVVYYA